jgi:acetyl-CoA carboxylase carboxyltransferase component
MPILRSVVNPSDPTFQDNEAVQLGHLAALNEEVAKALDGGGETYRVRHKARGKLLARERIALLLDEGSPFLEFSSLVGYGSEFAVGGAIVTGLGVVAGVECVIAANDPTVRGGAINPFGLKKHLRALEIARENRLPVINLVESGGADLPTQADLFIPAGQLFRDITRLSGLGIPTIAIVFGTSTAGGAYVPGMSDYAVLVDQGAKVFLGGPPLVTTASGWVERSWPASTGRNEVPVESKSQPLRSQIRRSCSG